MSSILDGRCPRSTLSKRRRRHNDLTNVVSSAPEDDDENNLLPPIADENNGFAPVADDRLAQFISAPNDLPKSWILYDHPFFPSCSCTAAHLIVCAFAYSIRHHTSWVALED